ncbi:iron ABC transporter permease, partial [Rhodovulum sulfidophilum]|nr:iron ABC transporter permease [Rhodovulum sulfidophilum]
MTEPLVETPPVSPLQSRNLYLRLTRRRLTLLTGIGLLTVICFLIDLSIGQAHYSSLEVLSALWDTDAPLSVRVILWDIRLPVALAALVVGASLAVAGVQMQTVLGNPLASPFTLGLSAAASFGAALGLILGVSLLPASAVAFAVPA